MPMEYALLIYFNEADAAKLSAAEAQAGHEEYRYFTKWLDASGKMKGGRPLERVANASTVRVRGGKTATIDGPFAETKEQLGGFYLAEAKDLDEAITIAERDPGGKDGRLEVRPNR